MTEFLIIASIIFAFSIIAVFSAPRKVVLMVEEYHKIPCSLGITGGQFARTALKYAGFNDADVKFGDGELTDRYIPGKKLIVLSKKVCFGESVAAIGIAAHEFGHALQHKNKSLYLHMIRIFSTLSFAFKMLIIPCLLSGLYLMLFTIAGVNAGMVFLWISLALYLSAILLKILLIPAEINASKLALEFLKTQKVVSADELKKIKAVLKTASLTYVAGAIRSILNPFSLLK